jgi:Domain of unknown function (DUF5615)
VRLCLEEHYSVQIAAELRELDHDVECVKERADLTGLADDDLFDILVRERRGLLTENVADFAPLVQRRMAAGEMHYGGIYTSPHAMPRSRNTIGVYVRALDSLLREHRDEDALANATAWLSP